MSGNTTSKKAEAKAATVTVTLPAEIPIPIGGGRSTYRLKLAEHANPADAVLRGLRVCGRAGNDDATGKIKGKTADAKRKRDIHAFAYMQRLFNGTTNERNTDTVLQYVRKAIRDVPQDAREAAGVILPKKTAEMTEAWCKAALPKLGQDAEAYWARTAAKVAAIQAEEQALQIKL